MIIDGKKIAQSFRSKIAAEVEELNKTCQRSPLLAVLMVGHDPASEVYVQHKRSACAEVGIETRQYRLPFSAKEVDLLHVIDLLNQDSHVDGILVQLPLPPHIDVHHVLESIVPQKDVDGLHPYNLGRLAQRYPSFRPCTPRGVMALLESIHYDCKGVCAVVVGCSNIVGQPMALELLSAGATVTICHSHTRKIQSYIEMADVLVTAVGKPNLIKGEWIKRGAAVIDVGITRLSSGKLVGDVEFLPAAKRAGWITPVPGGVGPMTVAMLLENVLLAAKSRSA